MRGDAELASVMRKVLVGAELMATPEGTWVLGLDYGTVELTEAEAHAIEEAEL